MSAHHLFARACWLAALVLSACVSEQPATQLLVIVDSDLPIKTGAANALVSLQVQILSGDGTRMLAPVQNITLREADSGDEGHSLPLSFALTPEGGYQSALFRLVVSGQNADGEDIVEHQVTTAFSKDAALVLEVYLARACLRELCLVDGARGDQTCDYASASCVDVPTRKDLPPLHGDGLSDYQRPDAGASEGDAEACVAPSCSAEGGAPDAGVDGRCRAHSACDDQVFCNGAEQCQPEHPSANAEGCVAGEAIACAGGETCAEQTKLCTPCALTPDGDRDGVAALACGGNDCSDGDPARFPGNKEICDGKDNDCDDVVDGASASATCLPPTGGQNACAAGRCQPSCPADYTLDGPQTACTRIDDCAGVTACTPGSCIDGVGAFTCDCPVGFEGDGTTRCQCPLGTRLAGAMCRTPAFAAAQTVATGVAVGGTPVLDIAGDGSAAVLWPSGPNVMGRSFLRASGWQAGPRMIASGMSLGAFSAAALPNGGAVYLGTAMMSLPHLFSGVLRLAGFSELRTHDQAFYTDGSYSPTVVSTGVGTVLATWYTYDTVDIRAHAYVDAYVDGSGWSGAQQQQEGRSASAPAIDSMGRGVLAYADRYSTNLTGAWGPFLPSANIRTPLALNRTGTGVGGGAGGSIARFSFAAGWSQPETINAGVNALAGIDDSGRILVVWMIANGDIVYRYYSNSAWSAEAPAFTGVGFTATGLRLAVSPNGEAVICWIEGSPPKVRAQRFVPGLGFQFVQVVHMPSGGTAFPINATCDIDVDGNALVVWVEEGDGTLRNVRASRME